MQELYRPETTFSPEEDLKGAPSLLVASPEGEIIDLPELAATVRWGIHEVVPRKDEWIPLPEGSDLYLMPGRRAVGYDRRTSERISVSEYEGVSVMAVAATILVTTSLSRTYRRWLMRLASKFGLRIFHPIAPSTIRLNIVCFRTSPVPVRVLFSNVLSSLLN